jgi:hypothetical protein
MQSYDTKDELARQKAELDKLKAVRVIKNTDGSLLKYDPVTGTTEQLKESDPLYVELMNSRIARNNRTGGGRSGGGRGKDNGTYGYTITKHTDPATGDIITTRVPTTGSNPNKAPAESRQQTTTVKKGKTNNNGNPKKGNAKQSKTGEKKKVNW